MPIQIALRLVLVGALLSVSTGGATAQASYPVTVTDDAGVQTTFTAPPQRIVSLNPGHTETVFALGAGDRLVAVDSFSNYPAEAQQIQPRLVTFPTLSVETVIALRPDLVLALVENDDVLGQIRGQGVPVLKLLPRDYDATSREIASLGRVLGNPQRGEELAAEMVARRDAVVQAVADAPRPRVFYEMDASDPTKPFAAGPHGFYGQLIDLAGGTNVFADLPGDFGQVSAESVVARDPELIVLADSYLPYNPQTPGMVAARPGWDQVTAVRNGAIYAVQEELFASAAPRLADGLEAMAYLLHPDRFASSGGPRSRPTSHLPYCAADQVPAFSLGFEALSAALGVAMGEPTECPHVDVANGDIYQQTTKGLAIYRLSDNTPQFVTSTSRWALRAEGLIELSTGPAAP
jgi:iron complex transport system substrate-binding protein